MADSVIDYAHVHAWWTSKRNINAQERPWPGTSLVRVRRTDSSYVFVYSRAGYPMFELTDDDTIRWVYDNPHRAPVAARYTREMLALWPRRVGHNRYVLKSYYGSKESRQEAEMHSGLVYDRKTGKFDNVLPPLAMRGDIDARQRFSKMKKTWVDMIRLRISFGVLDGYQDMMTKDPAKFFVGIEPVRYVGDSETARLIYNGIMNADVSDLMLRRLTSAIVHSWYPHDVTSTRKRFELRLKRVHNMLYTLAGVR